MNSRHSNWLDWAKINIEGQVSIGGRNERIEHIRKQSFFREMKYPYRSAVAIKVWSISGAKAKP